MLDDTLPRRPEGRLYVLCSLVELRWHRQLVVGIGKWLRWNTSTAVRRDFVIDTLAQAWLPSTMCRPTRRRQCCTHSRHRIASYP